MVFYLSAVINYIILMTLVGTRDVLQSEERLQGMSHKHIPKEKEREKKGAAWRPCVSLCQVQGHPGNELSIVLRQVDDETTGHNFRHN